MLNDGKTNRIAFVSYFKGEYSIRTLERKEPLHTAASSDFGAPGPIIDFQAPLQHTLVQANVAQEGTLREDVPRGPAAGERRRHEQRRHLRRHGRSPSATCSATSRSTSSPRRSRSTARCRCQLRRTCRARFQYALQGYSQTQFFYGQLGGVFYDPSLRAVHRAATLATRRAPCAAAARSASIRSTATAACEVSGGFVQPERGVQRPARCSSQLEQYQQQTYGQPVFRNGTLMPLGAAFIQETTIFREFGPLAGSTMRLAYDVAPKIGGTALAADLRRRRCATTCASAAPACSRRASAGSRASATSPTSCTSAATRDLRGYDYLQFVGQNVVFANAELRFPLIEAALTPIGVIGGIRGVFFAGIGGALVQQPAVGRTAAPASGEFKFATNQTEICQAVDRLQTRTLRAIRSSARDGQPPAHLRTAADDQRLPPAGRPRVVRPRARNLRARLPDPLRLVVADDCSTSDWEDIVFAASARPKARAAASGSASRASRSGSATTSRAGQVSGRR